MALKDSIMITGGKRIGNERASSRNNLNFVSKEADGVKYLEMNLTLCIPETEVNNSIRIFSDFQNDKTEAESITNDAIEKTANLIILSKLTDGALAEGHNFAVSASSMTFSFDTNQNGNLTLSATLPNTTKTDHSGKVDHGNKVDHFSIIE